MNGYNNGIDMVCELLNYCDIICAQEVWLKQYEAYKQVNVNDLFDGVCFHQWEGGTLKQLDLVDHKVVLVVSGESLWLIMLNVWVLVK